LAIIRERLLMRIIGCYTVIICVFLLGPWGHSCWGLEATDILERVHQRYTKEDFEADFFQEAHLKAMDMVDTAKGHLYFKPPGLMRWHYLTPEQYLIIVDGNSVWMYNPEDKQVMTGLAQDYLGRDGGADYFSNPKELTKEFTLELAPQGSEEQDYYLLRLVPKTKRPELAELHLFISKETFDIAKAVTINPFGDQTDLTFSSYRFNQGLDPSLFTFQVPKGVDVLNLQDEF
jgi:outer membrane lipoprotein carrier protein